MNELTIADLRVFVDGAEPLIQDFVAPEGSVVDKGRQAQFRWDAERMQGAYAHSRLHDMALAHEATPAERRKQSDGPEPAASPLPGRAAIGVAFFDSNQRHEGGRREH
jgi:hypothetical protein